MEVEFASLSESLLHLELSHVALSGSNLLHKDDILSGLGISEHDEPVVLLQEGVLSGVHIPWHILLAEVVVLDLELDGDHIGRGHGFLTLAVDVLLDGDEGHGLDNFL